MWLLCDMFIATKVLCRFMSPDLDRDAGLAQSYSRISNHTSR